MNEINVTPLIDVMLVLLVIFMLASPQMGLDVRLSEYGESGPAGPRPPVLALSAEGELTLNGQRVQRAELRAKLRETLTVRGDGTLFFQASEKLKYRDVVSVLDVAKGSGVKRLGILPAPE